MGMSAAAGKANVKAEPNVTPLVDVMMVLLIIFMVIIPQLSSGLAATPPVPGAEAPAYCEMGELPVPVLNSRVKRERPNSPETPLIR